MVITFKYGVVLQMFLSTDNYWKLPRSVKREFSYRFGHSWTNSIGEVLFIAVQQSIKTKQIHLVLLLLWPWFQRLRPGRCKPTGHAWAMCRSLIFIFLGRKDSHMVCAIQVGISENGEPQTHWVSWLKDANVGCFFGSLIWGNPQVNTDKRSATRDQTGWMSWSCIRRTACIFRRTLNVLLSLGMLVFIDKSWYIMINQS